MPNRYVREAAIKSKRVNSLTWHGEVFYRRLINKVDDFGRYHADEELLRTDLFPRQLDRVREADISRLLAECEEAGLLFRFEADGKPYLVMNQWEKGRALNSEYPSPPDNILEQMRTHVYVCKQPPPTPTLTPTPTPTPTDSDKVSKPLTEGGQGGEIVRGFKTGQVTRVLRGRRADVGALAEHVLGVQWVNDAGKWINRIHNDVERVSRVMLEVQNAIKEDRVLTTPAQMAENTWELFGKVVTPCNAA